MRTNARNIFNSIGMGFLGILLAIGVSYSTYASFYSDLSPYFSPFVSVLLFVFFFASFIALSVLLVLALMDSINTGLNILYQYLNLLHCFAPFITENLCRYLLDKSLIKSEY